MKKTKLNKRQTKNKGGMKRKWSRKKRGGGDGKEENRVKN